MRPFQMKLLPLICATMLVASCPSWASDQQGRFLEVEDDYGVDTTTFDLSTVQMIQPGRFTVVKTTIDTPDVMKLELKVLDTLRTYCARTDGQYPPPEDLFTLGPPDMPVKDIKVQMVYSGTTKLISWDYPYRRLASKNGYLYCNGENRTEGDLYIEARRFITNGLRTTGVFDCKRGLWGTMHHDDDDPARTMMWPVKRTTRGGQLYFYVCQAVIQQEPYMPDH